MSKLGLPTAVVLNMYHTGLGIARSLGERGVPVLGLSAQRSVYGGYTRYARTLLCPDSRNEPERLLEFLRGLGRTFDQRPVVFPTRDHDVVFLDRFRAELERYYVLAVPESDVVAACLDKRATYVAATAVGVSSPECRLISSEAELGAALARVRYPCVLKPVAAHHWRTGRNWELVGGRKALPVYSEKDLLEAYTVVQQADGRVLLQDMIPGGDECLAIAACYMDNRSECLAAFNTRKLVQAPEGFGTGCVVESADIPELLEPTVRLLRSMKFSGIAEVEYKWDAAAEEYRLIEINPRPWDQHRLGAAMGVDLAYIAYCDYTGQPRPARKNRFAAVKWIAEDAFLLELLASIRRRDTKARKLIRAARGRRIYAMWSWKDPLPMFSYLASTLVPMLVKKCFRMAANRMR